MNYRHAFHAGNFADVIKHSLLVILLEALNRKPGPWCYYDTHAGAGGYALDSPAVQRSGEWKGGVGRLWPTAADAPAAVTRLLEIVAAGNPALAAGQAPRRYPGSPWIATALARAQDRLVLAELHPEEVQALKQNLGADRRVAVHQRDGYEMLQALTPPAERRGLVLMDPPFEQLDEFERMLAALKGAHARWPMGIYALWYPLKDESGINRFRRALRGSGLGKLLDTKLQLAPGSSMTFNGSGMLLVNPPWGCETQVRETLSWLAERLAPGTGRIGLEWLAGE